MSLGDGIRLSVGTLTVLPVRPPRVVDSRSGSWAMTFAPLIGLGLGASAVVLLWLLGWVGTMPLGQRPLPPLVAAALIVGLLALVTRGLHLDGLADTADGLGSGKPAEQALAVMRKSDIGPFGVVTLVLVLLIQVAALSASLSSGRGPASVVVALVLSRLALPLVCSHGIGAARADGLGQAVAGSVSRTQLLVTAVLALGAVAVLASGLDIGGWRAAVTGLVVGACALGVAMSMCLWCLRRLGGVTGDVMGACVEVTFSASLVMLTLV